MFCAIRVELKVLPVFPRMAGQIELKGKRKQIFQFGIESLPFVMSEVFIAGLVISNFTGIAKQIKFFHANATFTCIEQSVFELFQLGYRLVYFSTSLQIIPF